MHSSMVPPSVSGLALSLLLAVMSGNARAADSGVITTDRPDFSESPEVVGPGRFQIETSVAYERARFGNIRSRTYSTPTLLRLGLSDAWELRLESDGLMRQRTSQPGLPSERESGAADAELGLKWHVQDGDEEAGKASVCWLFHIQGRTGSSAFRGAALRPSVRMVSEWDLEQGWSIGVMPGLYSDKNDQGRRYLGGLLALALSKNITDKTTGVLELAAQQFTSNKNGGKVYTLDLGLAWLLSNSVQLDAGADFGLNKNAPDLTVALGLSVKF